MGDEKPVSLQNEKRRPGRPRHALGIAPPADVRLFIAVIENKVDDVKKALDDGANPNVTFSEIFVKYRRALYDLHHAGVTGSLEATG